MVMRTSSVLLLAAKVLAQIDSKTLHQSCPVSALLIPIVYKALAEAVSSLASVRRRLVHKDRALLKKQIIQIDIKRLLDLEQ